VNGADLSTFSPAMKAIEGLKKAKIAEGVAPARVPSVVAIGKDTYGSEKSKEAWAGEPRAQG